MSKRFSVRVAESYRFPTARSAGREFTKEPVTIHEGEPGWEEIVSCPILAVEEMPALPPLDVVDATNAARALALELGIDLATIEGSGVEGRILKGDVAAALAAIATDVPTEDEDLEQAELAVE